VLRRNRGWTILLTKMMTVKKTMMKTMPMTMMMTLEVGLQRRGKASNVWAAGLQRTTRQISSVEEKSEQSKRKFGSLALGLQCPQSNEEKKEHQHEHIKLKK
jgi:hypothetical protein